LCAGGGTAPPLSPCGLKWGARTRKSARQEKNGAALPSYAVIPTKRKRVEGSPRKNAFSLSDFSVVIAPLLISKEIFRLRLPKRLGDKISEMTERRGD